MEKGRILAIDFGGKRTGIAVTDTLQIIATALTTVDTSELYAFLIDYALREPITEIVVGYPTKLNGSPFAISQEVDCLCDKLRHMFPKQHISLVDERYTTTIAQRTMIAMGVNKKTRRNKTNLDKISAVLILQSYMQSKRDDTG